MPSRSTNLNAPSNAVKKVKPDKRKRAADAAAAAEAEAAQAKRAKVDESATEAAQSNGEASGSALPAGEDSAAGPSAAKVAKVVAPTAPTKVNGEFLPSKEDIENDKEISEGARLGTYTIFCLVVDALCSRDVGHELHATSGESLDELELTFALLLLLSLSSSAYLFPPALLYATLYLRFNPSPIYRPVPTKASKSMKANHPLPADPWAAQHQNPLFQSDFTPTDAAFELTAKQYADKKKAFRGGMAKKGDGVTGERWKFNKPREGWLLRWACEEKQVRTTHL